MTNINSTVETALANNGLGQYTRQAAPIVQALVQREEQAVARIIEFAVQKGLSRDEAIRVFEGEGFHVPNANAQAANEGDVVRRLDALTEFARRHGFRG